MLLVWPAAGSAPPPRRHHKHRLRHHHSSPQASWSDSAVRDHGKSALDLPTKMSARERQASSVSSGSNTSGDGDSHGDMGHLREGDGEGKIEGGGGTNAAPDVLGIGVNPEPRVPFCRTEADVGNMWFPAWDPDNQRIQTAKRVLVFGGKG